MYRRFVDAVEGAGARQHHRVRQDAAVHAGRAALGRRRHRALSALGVPRHEQGRARASTRRCAARARRRTSSPACRRATSCTTILDYHAYESKLDELFDQREAAPKPKKSVALSGVPAGNTALCTVGRTGNDLHYRGYDILEFAERREFEEVAYLLVHEKLPNAAELAGYKKKLQGLRGIPAAVQGVLERIPATRASDGRDAHRLLGPRHGPAGEGQDHKLVRARATSRTGCMACFGSMLLYWYHYSHSGRRIEVETDDDSIGGHFLHLLHGREPSPTVGARDAHLAHPVRRARVQRVHLHLPRDRRHRLRHVLRDHRRHRRAARAQARRRQRSRLRRHRALRHPDEAEADMRTAHRRQEIIIGFGHPCTPSATRATR